MSMACHSHPLHKKTILRRAMTAWRLEDITPLRTSQEAEETKEKRKRKAQITFLVPSVKFRCPMPAFRLFEYLIRFWSYQARDYTVMKPRTWPTVTISSYYDLTDNCFSFTSTLTDAMCSMDMSCSLDSLTSHSRSPYHVPPARVLVRFPFRFMCFLTCTNMDWRLVSLRFLITCIFFRLVISGLWLDCLRFSLMSFPFCLVDLSLCLPLLPTLSFCSSSTRLLSHYFWTLTRLWLISPVWIFVLVSRRPLYIRVGDGTAPHLQSTLQPP